MARKPKPPVVDPYPFAPQPPRPITGTELHASLVAYWSTPAMQELLRNTPSGVLLDPDSRPADKLAAWEKVLKMIYGFSEKQQLEHSGAVVSRIERVIVKP